MNMNLQTSGDGEGQGGLVCYSPWGHKELGMTGQLNNTHSGLLLSHINKIMPFAATWWA